jgi:YrhC-like protein
MQKAKGYYEKMVDYKQFARVMLALSAFLYLGVVIPSVDKNQTDLIIMMFVTTIFLVGSIFFLIRSKSYYQKLLNMEEGQEFLIKK